MPTSSVNVRLATTVGLLGLALTAGCLNQGSSDDNPFGIARRDAIQAAGLALSADPTTVVIDPDDPTTPTDPAHGDEKYRTTSLLAVATDSSGIAQVALNVTFGTAAGVLESGGVPVATDSSGRAMDVLRVYVSDPDSFEVSVSDSTPRTTTILVRKVVLAAPVANAGADVSVDCGTTVTLDGSGSTDANSDIATFEWFEHYGAADSTLLGTGETLDVDLPVGDHTITLRVTDSSGKTSTDEVLVTVVAVPSTVDLHVSPSVLWPPNHKLVHITTHVTVTGCGADSAGPTITLESVTSNEPDDGNGDGNTTGDIQGVTTGTDDFDFWLRAERAGGGSGRIYTIVYSIVGSDGVETTATTEVIVPHDQGGHGGD